MLCRTCGSDDLAPLGDLCHECAPAADDAFPSWVLYAAAAALLGALAAEGLSCELAIVSR